MNARLVLVLGWFAVAMVATARAEVEFAGYMRTPQGEARFVLTDPATQKTSEWIGVGGSFAGYRVTGFEAKGETLAVEKDGVARQLRLKNAALVARAGPTITADKAKSLSPMAPEEIFEKQKAVEGEFLARSQESVRQTVRKLRETLPEGHPQIIEAEKILAMLLRMTEGEAAGLYHTTRILLLKGIREHGDGPQQLAALQATLREIDIRLARQRAEMAVEAAR